jgi:hypothetical protein
MKRLVLLLLLLSVSGQHCGARGGVRLDGTFIQYQPWMTKLNERAWRQELNAMHRAGMRFIILQHLISEQTRYIPDTPDKPDPTRIILDYADSHEMKVFVGLATECQWFRVRQWKDYLGPAAAANIRLADQVWARYGTHRSFAGWYLPQELWDGPFTQEQIGQVRRFYRSLADHCRSLATDARRPVAIAPFYKGTIPPEEVETLYADLLRDSGIDILMMQDGVGAKGWDQEIEKRVVPYYKAFERACRTNQVEFWADIECFRLVGKSSSGTKQLAPADAPRLGWQLLAAAPFVRRCVTFDAFHCMSPRRDDARAKMLYRDYVREFVDREFVPASHPAGH